MSAGSKSSDGLDEGTCTVMETSMLEEEAFFTSSTGSGAGVSDRGNKKQLESLCRVCANASDYFIPIFEGEGLEHQLDMKIQKHLPIQVLETDNLPAHVCYQCASTLIAWHDLVTACVEADKKLHRLLQAEADEEFGGDRDEKVIEFFNEPPVDSDGAEEFSEPSTSAVVVELKESLLPSQKRKPAGKGKQRKARESASSESEVKVSTVPADSKDACTGQKEAVESASSTERCRVVSQTPLKDFQAHLSLRQGTKSDIAAVSSEVVPLWIKPQDCCARDDVLMPASRNSRCRCANHQSDKQRISLILRAPASNVSRCRYRWRKPRQEPAKKPRSSKTSKAELQTGVSSKNFPFEHLHKGKGHSVVCDVEELKRKKVMDVLKKEVHDSEDTNEEKNLEDKIDDGSAQTCMSNNSKSEHKKSSPKCTLFQCPVCGKHFALKDSYFRHMRIHTDERPFTCHVCGKQFRDSGGLSRHLKDVHVGIKNFQCDYCGRSFASKATRDDHHRTHTGERPYVCDSCGKTFRSKASLYIHNKTHSDLFPHTCSTCGKSFRRRQEVLAHVTTHTGEKPHVCEQCGKGFRVRGELQRHKLIHSDDKPYTCTTCGLNFKQRRYLRNHERARHGRQITL